jgi:hypothetical protein
MSSKGRFDAIPPAKMQHELAWSKNPIQDTWSTVTPGFAIQICLQTFSFILYNYTNAHVVF